MGNKMKILKSRTFWVIVATFVFNGLEAIKDSIPPEFQVAVNAILLILGTYFRTNPKQKFNENKTVRK